MIDVSNIEEIYVYEESCDLRMGVQGLSILAQSLEEISNMKHKLFVFFGKSKRNVKIIELDNDGWWLYQKKLFEGQYIFPNGTKTITKEELEMFLNGLDVNTYRAHKGCRIKCTF